MSDLDAALLAQGVAFLPWLGSRYETGFRGRRLLVLGESHYWSDYQPMTPESTRDCVRDVIKRADWVNNFWKFLEQAHLNVERHEMAASGDEFWNAIAFYNFVQVSVGEGPRQAPSWDNFVAAREPFAAVIAALKPERIYVCGKRLWGSMDDTPEDLFLHDDLQGYRLPSGKVAWCLARVHPSSGRYSWRRVHQVIDSFLVDPRSAVQMVA
jgi:hypothetical protein